MSAAPPTVTIVIPVLNRLDLTTQCLEALERTVAPGLAEVVVVDNASTDGTTDFLREQEATGRLRALVNEENVGFARACNAAARVARSEFLLLLNNDTIPQPGWLDAMLAAFERHPLAGVVGSRLLYADGRIQHAGMFFLPDGRLEHAHRFADRDAPEVLEEREYPCVTGACLLMRRSLWEELGGLDEGYPMYVEDVDLCMKVWASGHRVVYTPDSVVFHLENASVPNAAWRDQLVLRGVQRLHERWGGRWPAAVRRLAWPTVLPGGPPHFAALAFADELVADRALLAGFRLHRDEGTLVIALPYGDGALFEALSRAVAEAGLDAADGPDLLVHPVAEGKLAALAPNVAAVLTRRPLPPELAGKPVAHAFAPPSSAAA
jgi:GT2 family glycosyltransferase